MREYGTPQSVITHRVDVRKYAAQKRAEAPRPARPAPGAAREGGRAGAGDQDHAGPRAERGQVRDLVVGEHADAARQSLQGLRQRGSALAAGSATPYCVYP